MSKTKICKIFKNDLDKDIIGNGICLDTHEFRTLNYPFSGLFGFNKMLYLKRKKNMSCSLDLVANLQTLSSESIEIVQ